MKVAVCVPLDLNYPGGVEKHVLCLAEALGRLGLHIDVFGAKGRYANRGTGPAPADSAAFGSLARFQHAKYDIIHTHSGFYGPRFLAMQINRRRRQRYVHTLHGIGLDYLFACRDWFNWRCYYSTAVEAAWSRYADRVIAVSDSVRNWALKCFGIDRGKIAVIRNGFRPTAIGPDCRAEIRSQLGLAADDIVAMFVGRCYDKVKGAKDIVASMRQLHRELPQLKLMAVPGTGFSPAPWLIATGPLRHQALPSYYAAADLFVNASLSEGMPLTIVEAMAAGLPIAASAVGGNAEVIEHNHNGLLLKADRSDLTNQLRRLISDPDLRTRLGRSARRRVQPLTWTSLAEQTLTLYQSLYKNTNPPA